MSMREKGKACRANIKVRLYAEELELIDGRAKQQGLTRSEYIRQSLTNHTPVSQQTTTIAPEHLSIPEDSKKNVCVESPENGKMASNQIAPQIVKPSSKEVERKSMHKIRESMHKSENPQVKSASSRVCPHGFMRVGSLTACPVCR